MTKTIALFVCVVGLAISAPVSALVIINTSVPGQVFGDDVDLVTGGQVNGNLSLNGVDYTVNVFDGVITGDLGVLNGFRHTANVLGGAIGNDIFLNGSDHVVNISGGSFGGQLFSNGNDNIVTVTGFGLSVVGDFNVVGATVTGFLADGTAISNLFRSNGLGSSLNIINLSVPEPGTLGLLGAGLLGLGFMRRRRVT